MKSPVLLLAAIVILLLIAPLAMAIEDYRSEEYSEIQNIITGIGETEAEVILNQELFGGRTAHVTLSSDNEDDLPIASDYDDSTQTLTITGLNANDTRDMTIAYLIPALEEYFGADLTARTMLTIVILGVFGLIGGAVYSSTRGD